MYRFFLLIALIFGGCGYAPIAHYSQNALGNSVYIDLKVNLANTENSVALRDLLYRVIVARFQKEIKGQEEADSIISVIIRHISDSSIATDQNGFTTFYRANVTIEFEVKNSSTRQSKSLTNSAYYDYAVSLADPTITYNNRLEAITEAAGQCVDRLISQIAYYGKDMKR